MLSRIQWLAKAGVTLTANITVIKATTVNNKMVRLNALLVTVCCCYPIIFVLLWLDGFALHLDHGNKREKAPLPKV